MKCEKCGADISANDAFCPACGAVVRLKQMKTVRPKDRYSVSSDDDPVSALEERMENAGTAVPDGATKVMPELKLEKYLSETDGEKKERTGPDPDQDVSREEEDIVSEKEEDTISGEDEDQATEPFSRYDEEAYDPREEKGGVRKPVVVFVLLGAIIIGFLAGGIFYLMSSQNRGGGIDSQVTQKPLSTATVIVTSETPAPTATAKPTSTPAPSAKPTTAPAPTPEPTREPEPTRRPEPTRAPEPTREPEPEPTEAPQTPSGTDSSYLLPDSSSRQLTAEEVSSLSAYEKRIARNEIYARHGRRFSDPELQEYFNNKSWYNGSIPPEQFSDSMLSDVEKYNVDLINSME